MPPKKSNRPAGYKTFATLSNEHSRNRITCLEDTVKLEGVVEKEKRLRVNKGLPPREEEVTDIWDGAPPPDSQPQQGELDIRMEHQLSQNLFLDDFKYINVGTRKGGEPQALADLRQAPQRQLNALHKRFRDQLVSMARNHDNLKSPFLVPETQARNAYNFIGLEVPRYKYGVQAYALLVAWQARWYDLYNLLKENDHPEWVLLFFVEHDSDGRKYPSAVAFMQKVKQLSPHWPPHIADPPKDAGRDAQIKPFAPHHSDARKQVVKSARAELTVRQMMDICPQSMKVSLEQSFPDWLDLPPQDPEFSHDTPYGGTVGRPNLPQPTAYWKATGERYPPRWMIEGRDGPDPASIAAQKLLKNKKLEENDGEAPQ